MEMVQLCSTWFHTKMSLRYIQPVVHRTCSNVRVKVRRPSLRSTILTNDDLMQNSKMKVEDKKRFEWYSNWYPIMPVLDLDKRVPHGKKVMGLDVVVWWDSKEKEWKVFHDRCPHRMAPLSQGRIDHYGRLQCSYHGWCFNAIGHCDLVPQALHQDGAVTLKKACAVVYPSRVQNQIVWFWPNIITDNVLENRSPPYMSELDDPGFTKSFGTRDLPYGYEVMVENLSDAAHAPYTHFGLMSIPEPSVRVDREGGGPINMTINRLDEEGFLGKQEEVEAKFMAPCVFYTVDEIGSNNTTRSTKPKARPKSSISVFICVPVSPGNSRLIWCLARNYDTWIPKIVPRWMVHVRHNLLIDSALSIIHHQERNVSKFGSENWETSCVLATKSDAFAVAFRRWLNKYGGGQVDWIGNQYYSDAALPPTPPREQLMDRYRSHVVNCRSCNLAYNSLNALQVILQAVAFVGIGIGALAPPATRLSVISVAVLCFLASIWLAHFIYKSFRFQDFDHARQCLSRDLDPLQSLKLLVTLR